MKKADSSAPARGFLFSKADQGPSNLSLGYSSRHVRWSVWSSIPLSESVIKVELAKTGRFSGDQEQYFKPTDVKCTTEQMWKRMASAGRQCSHILVKGA